MITISPNYEFLFAHISFVFAVTIYCHKPYLHWYQLFVQTTPPYIVLQPIHYSICT